MVEEEHDSFDATEEEERRDAAGPSFRKKWVPRPLTTVCGVCGSPATEVQHYGAISCYSCRCALPVILLLHFWIQATTTYL